MNPTTENSIREDQIQSFGKLMAGFSHDMKNHLGIIRESNGLMSDLVEMGGLGENERLAEQLKKAISTIERRVVIAADMLHHLSSYAHRLDTPCASFQVNDLITEEYTFVERFSRLQQVNVTLELGGALSPIFNEPSLLQHVFYRAYVLCLKQLSAGDNLSVITRQNVKIVEIIFRLSTSLSVSHEPLFDSNLQAAVEKMGGTLETVVTTTDHTDITLTIPSLPNRP